MANNRERVDAQLDQLEPQWQPNVEHALQRLRTAKTAKPSLRKQARWAYAAAAFAFVIALSFFQSPRVFAQRCVAACQLLFANQSIAPPVAKVGDVAPDFTLTGAQGGFVKLSSYRGKVVLLDFWATWCGGCKVEIPWFVEFNSRYQSKGLAVIGVSLDDEGWKVVRPFLQAKRIDYPVVIGAEVLAKRYGVEAMPLTLLIGRDGRIAASHVGLTGKTIFEKEIAQLLR